MQKVSFQGKWVKKARKTGGEWVAIGSITVETAAGSGL